MEDPQLDKTDPGLEEALHPMIGNGAAMDPSVQGSGIRSVDPGKLMDQLLLSEDQQLDIISQWQHELEGGADEAGDGNEINLIEPIDATEGKEPVSSVDAVDEKRPDTLHPKPVKDVTPDGAKLSLTTPEKKKPAKAGKRVRKIAKTAEAAEQENNRKLQQRFAPFPDEQLTPFTQWLKGLKGSEYVHPFEDDFAFLQSEGPATEGISETYADLLAAQGYKDQAIDMYRRLMEKYPEKSRFFAAKIETLQ